MSEAIKSGWPHPRSGATAPGCASARRVLDHLRGTGSLFAHRRQDRRANRKAPCTCTPPHVVGRRRRDALPIRTRSAILGRFTPPAQFPIFTTYPDILHLRSSIATELTTREILQRARGHLSRVACGWWRAAPAFDGIRGHGCGRGRGWRNSARVCRAHECTAHDAYGAEHAV